MAREDIAEAFLKEYLKRLLMCIGTPYGTLNCVTLPLRAAAAAYRLATGRQLPDAERIAFLNGGALLRNLMDKGLSFAVHKPEDLKEAHGAMNGKLLMRLEPVTRAAGLFSLYAAGDRAIFKDKYGNATTLDTPKAARDCLDGIRKGRLIGEVFRVRLYLTAVQGPGEEVFVVHASSAHKKTVREKMESYLDRHANRRCSYLVVDPLLALGLRSPIRSAGRDPMNRIRFFLPE